MKSGPPIVTVTLNPAIDQTLHIPGFAAGRVNRVTASHSHAGGKGINVACVLADLGHPVTATGFLGRKNVDVFEAAFERKGIGDGCIRIEGETRTGIKIVDPLIGETTDVNFPGLLPTQDEMDALLRRIDDLAAPGAWFVLSGSVPAGLPDDVYAGLIATLRGKECPAVLDTSGPPLRAALAPVIQPDVIKPNVEELSALLGRPLDHPAAVRDAAASLVASGMKCVVVSMGGEGAVFVDRERALLARPPLVEVRSTVGAGDAMVAGIVSALIQNLPLDEVARTATACGAYAVTEIGAGFADPAAYRNLLGRVEIEPLEH